MTFHLADLSTPAPAWSPDTWAAIAAWITATLAAVAGIVAARQLRESRALRNEQAQPYVVAFLEPSAADESFIDLVIKNFGATAATDIKMRVDPSPRRAPNMTGAQQEDLWLPSTIPTLVPQQEWRTYWDFIPRRVEAQLPASHKATVDFKDSRSKQSFTFSFDLDWHPFINRGHLVIYGPHHTAKALRAIEKITKGWRESASGGIAVTVRDGDAKDAATRERVRELRAAKAD